MGKFTINTSDGRSFTIEANRAPTSEEALNIVQTRDRSKAIKGGRIESPTKLINQATQPGFARAEQGLRKAEGLQPQPGIFSKIGQRAEAAAFGSANRVLLGLPEKGFQALGLPTPRGPGRGTGELAGSIQNVIGLGGAAARGVAGGARKIFSPIARKVGQKVPALREASKAFSFRRGTTGAETLREGTRFGAPEFLQTPAEGDPIDIGGRAKRAALPAAAGVVLGGALSTGAATKEALTGGAKEARLTRFLRAREVSAAQKESGAKLAALEQEQEVLKQLIDKTADKAVLKAKSSAFTGAMKDNSDEFGKLMQQGIAEANQPISVAELLVSIEKRLGDSDAAKRVFAELNIGPEITQLLQKGAKVQLPSLSSQQVFASIQNLRAKLSTTVKSGKRGFTSAENSISEASAALMDVLRAQGAKGFDQAFRLWSKWAPIKNKGIKLFQPFEKAGIETKAGQRFLKDVAGPRPQAGDVRFIDKFEKALGIPLRRDIKEQMAALSSVEKKAAETSILNKQAVDRIKLAGSRAGSQQFKEQMKGLAARKISGSAAWILRVGVMYDLIRRGLNLVKSPFQQ